VIALLTVNTVSSMLSHVEYSNKYKCAIDQQLAYAAA